jgi:hypothetical protein
MVMDMDRERRRAEVEKTPEQHAAYERIWQKLLKNLPEDAAGLEETAAKSRPPEGLDPAYAVQELVVLDIQTDIVNRIQRGIQKLTDLLPWRSLPGVALHLSALESENRQCEALRKVFWTTLLAYADASIMDARKKGAIFDSEERATITRNIHEQLTSIYVPVAPGSISQNPV